MVNTVKYEVRRLIAEPDGWKLWADYFKFRADAEKEAIRVWKSGYKVQVNRVVCETVTSYMTPYTPE